MARTKAGKAASGEGSIFQRKSDGRWVGKITLDDGSRKAFYAWTQAEARERLDAARTAKRAGRLRAAKSQVVGDYLDAWLETKRHSIRPSTYVNYQTASKWLSPHVGKRRLDKLAPAHVQQAYGDMLDRGLSKRSVQICHVVLRMALKRAVKLGLAAYNPTDDVDAPRPSRRAHTVLTLEQARILFESTGGDALWVTMLTCGLRIGEALALRWEDVNLDERTLRVQRAIQRQTGKGLVLIEPKTAAGRRTVILTALATDALRTHRTRQLKHRLSLGGLWEDHGLIFCTDFGKPLDPMNAYHRFHKALDKASLPRIRQHDLRHTAATLMLSEGIHPKVVQEMLGHSNINLTLATYSHVLPTMQRDAADRMDDAFNRAKIASF
jgi:integrase